MIRNELARLRGEMDSLSQLVLHPPRQVRIKEYFPKDNTVTIQFVNAFDDNGGASLAGPNGDHRFTLGYRGDISESMSPQPGDLGLLFYTGFQIKRGFVLISHSEGGLESSNYVPIRGNWSI